MWDEPDVSALPEGKFVPWGGDLHCKVRLTPLEAFQGGTLALPWEGGTKDQSVGGRLKPGDRITLSNRGRSLLGFDRGDLIYHVDIFPVEREQAAVDKIKSFEKQNDNLSDHVRTLTRELAESRDEVEAVRVSAGKASEKKTVKRLALALMPSIDSLEAAVTSMSSLDDPAHQDGIDLIRDMLLQTLESYGVKVVPALGKPFNPHVHEAVALDDDASVGKNRVTGVMQQGYTLDGMLLRAAKVRVSQ